MKLAPNRSRKASLVHRQPLGQRSQIAAKNSGNPAHFLERKIPLTALNPAHVTTVNGRFKGEPFLRKPFCFAGHADSFSKCLERGVFFQRLPVLADEDLSSTDYNPHFVLALDFKSGKKNRKKTNRPMETEYSLYRRHGKPERQMAEIRRELLRKISVRLKKERAKTVSLKEKPSATEVELEANQPNRERHFTRLTLKTH